jgi:hypothetical protein
MVHNQVRNCDYGDYSRFVLRQWLSKEEVDCILRTKDDADDFSFGDLTITIKGGPNVSGVIPHRLMLSEVNISSQELRELYRKLQIEIEQATFSGHWEDLNELKDRGLLITVQVHCVNLRSIAVEISNFKLTVKINGKEYVTHAERGEIYDYGYKVEGGVKRYLGSPLKNLNPPQGSPVILHPRQDCEGSLQFIIKDVVGEPEQIIAILAIIDISGEEHPAECSLQYKD